MYRNLLTLIFLFAALSALGQARTEWQEGYKLSVLDFAAEPPKSQVEQGQSYYLAAHLDYARITNRSAANTKNLNASVTAYFIPTQSWLQQGEGTEILLKYAQINFDLLELYARKYRQRLYEKKQLAANLRYLQQAQQEVNIALSKRRAEMHNAVAESDSKADAFHELILKEIAELTQFSKQNAIGQ